MKICLNLLLVLVLMLSHAVDGYSQNPKRTKHYAKARKKMKKPRKEQIEYTSREKFDTDNDGVPNYYDHCPDTPEGQQVTTFGCPPDSDGDGIFDINDECVNQAGPKKNKGCPYLDSDGDGLLDDIDVCPNTPGEHRFVGCPDTDKDGTPDSKDNCVNEPGPKGNHGCPYEDHDTDGDGVMDSQDKCTLVPGEASNQGCPQLNAEEEAALKAAFENL